MKNYILQGILMSITTIICGWFLISVDACWKFAIATLTIYNSFGQQVKQIKNISGQTITLFRDNLASGLYFVLLTEENKIIAVDKLVITDK